MYIGQVTTQHSFNRNSLSKLIFHSTHYINYTYMYTSIANYILQIVTFKLKMIITAQVTQAHGMKLCQFYTVI